MLWECDAVSVIQIIKILFYHARLEHMLLKCFMPVKTCMSTTNKKSLYEMSEGVQNYVVNEAKHDNNFCTMIKRLIYSPYVFLAELSIA